MKRNAGSPVTVECIGSVANVELLIANVPPERPFAVAGSWAGSVLGNDAVVVARHVLAHGYSVMCQLLDPTKDDASSVIAALGSGAIHAIDGAGSRGGHTRSLCVESSAGERSWVFSRRPVPQAPLKPIAAQVAYVDWYPELSGYLRVELPRAAPVGQFTFINVSAMGVSAVSLPVAPAIVQASGGSSLNEEEARAMAVRLLHETSAERSVVTLGERGAVLAMRDGIWREEPPTKAQGSILGAGAVLSSRLIVGRLNGLDCGALLRWAVESTAKALLNGQVA